MTSVTTIIASAGALNALRYQKVLCSYLQLYGLILLRKVILLIDLTMALEAFLRF